MALYRCKTGLPNGVLYKDGRINENIDLTWHSRNSAFYPHAGYSFSFANSFLYLAYPMQGQPQISVLFSQFNIPLAAFNTLTLDLEYNGERNTYVIDVSEISSEAYFYFETGSGDNQGHYLMMFGMTTDKDDYNTYYIARNIIFSNYNTIPTEIKIYSIIFS